MAMFSSYEKYRLSGGTASLKQIVVFLLKTVVILFVMFFILSTFFVTAFYVDTASMCPTLSAGDCVIASPLAYGTWSTLFGFRFPGLGKPQRGDMVVVSPPYKPETPFVARLMEPAVQFFALQKAHLLKDSSGNSINAYSVKRIVGLPGETVKMDNFQVYIRQEGRSDYEGEMSLSGYTYKIETDTFLSGRPEQAIAFTGNMDPLTLGREEYFVLGDNRNLFSDSRSWGAVKENRLVSKVIFRYWPFDQFGSP